MIVQKLPFTTCRYRLDNNEMVVKQIQMELRKLHIQRRDKLDIVISITRDVYTNTVIYVSAISSQIFNTDFLFKSYLTHPRYGGFTWRPCLHINSLYFQYCIAKNVHNFHFPGTSARILNSDLHFT